MKNKLRILAGLCAVIMSVSVITPAYALPQNNINFLKKRLSIVSNRLNNSVLDNESKEYKDIKNLLDSTKRRFYEKKENLLSSSDENAHADFLDLHNNIDDIFNKISLYNLKLCGFENKGLNSSLLEFLNERTNRASKLTNNLLVGSELEKIRQRISQLNIRTAYFAKDLENSSGSLSHESHSMLNKDFDDTQWRLGLESDNVISALNEKAINDYGSLYKFINGMNHTIDEAHKRINHLKNKLKQTLKCFDGIYTIESKLDSNKCLDIQYASKDDWANLQLFEKNSTSAQKFKIKYNKEAGYYTISPICSNKLIDVALAGKNWGTNIQQYSFNNKDAQKWYIIPDDNGYCSIISVYNGLCMDVSNANAANGTNIQCWGMNGTDAQKFKLVKS